MNPRRALAALLLAVTATLTTVGTAGAQEQAPAPPAQPAPADPAAPPAPPPGPPGIIPGAPGSNVVVIPDAPAESPPPTPEAPGEGTSSLLRGPDLRKGQAPTLYEKYGSAGYDLDSDLGWRDTGDGVGHIAATVIWGMTRWIADASINIFQWSYSLDLFGMTGGAIGDVTAALNRILYQPFVIPMVILVGLWLTWNALIKKRGTLAAESSIWVIFALAAAVVFMAQPARIVGGLNNATTGLSRSILGGVAGLDPKTGPADGVQTRGGYGGDPADAELRAVADRMWRTYIYAPWAVLEFGTTTKAPQWGERLLAAKTLTDDETAAANGDPVQREAIDRKNKDEYEQIRSEIKKDPQAKAYFQGHRPGQRISTAGLAFAGVLVSGGLIAGLALATLFAQLALLLLAMLAPVFLLAAVHPGAGRVIATRWANLLVYTAVKRVAYSVLLSVILVVNGALIDQGSKLGWGVAMTLSVALSGALFFYRKPFLSIIERIGSGGIAAAPALTNAAQGTSGRLARRAATGAALTGVVTGAGTAILASKAGRFTARKFNKLSDLNTLPSAQQAKAAGEAKANTQSNGTNGAGEHTPSPAGSFKNGGKAGPRTGSKTTRAVNATNAARHLSPRRVAGSAPTAHRDAITDHFATPPPDGGTHGQH